MKAIFENVLAELTGETEMHRNFLKLKTKAQVVLDDAKELPESAKIAAIDMISKFTDLLNKDKTNEDKRSPSYQNEMVREARKIIAYYETDLEVYPGFWNRFKNLINTFFQSLGIHNLFEVKKTPFGFFDGEYQKMKQTALASQPPCLN